MSDRSALDEFLKEMGFAGSGGVLFLESERSETRELRRSEKAVVVTISTRARDRHGDIIDPEGVNLSRFRKNPVVLYAHDYDGLPIARSLWERVRDGELIAKPQFHLETELSREVWALVEKGVLSAWSVGFVPEKWEPTPDGRGFRVRKWDLLEYSCVPVPANFEALTRELRERRITAPALVKSLAPLGLKGPDLVEQPVRLAPLDAEGDRPARATAGDTGDSAQVASLEPGASGDAAPSLPAAGQPGASDTGARAAAALAAPSSKNQPQVAAMRHAAPAASPPGRTEPAAEKTAEGPSSSDRSPSRPAAGPGPATEPAPQRLVLRALPRLGAEEIARAMERAFEKVLRRARGDDAGP